MTQVAPQLSFGQILTGPHFNEPMRVETAGIKHGRAHPRRRDHRTGAGQRPVPHRPPVDWLTDVLARLQDHPAKRIDELLPWNWKRARLQQAAA